ncbi:MAG TPA: hypothetical protein VG167_10950 [Verrucomicrobiae bacterium]|nr:hypothetical protein [Verrucomicrobiae bacterium]
MKNCVRLLFVAGLMLLAAVGATGCASRQNAVPANSNSATRLTGSYLPQSVQRNGRITDGMNNVRVVDQSDLDQSGGATVEQSLRLLGEFGR